MSPRAVAAAEGPDHEREETSMAATNRTLAGELDNLVATLADLGDYLRETEHERDDRDRRTLEGFAGDALLEAVQARRDL
jgi:hypothetical protein